MPQHIQPRHYNSTVKKLSLDTQRDEKGWHMRQDESDWIDDIANNIDQYNDNLKPSIATLRFDNNQSLPCPTTDDISSCFNFCDEDGLPLDPKNLPPTCNDYSKQDNYIHGEILAEDAINCVSLPDKPTISTINRTDDPAPFQVPSNTSTKTSIIPSTSPSSSTTWIPTLLPIREETTNDLRIVKKFNDDGIWRISRRTKDRYTKLSNKIQRMLQTSNGLYRAQINTVTLQNDGGANRSCTNMKHLLVDFKRN